MKQGEVKIKYKFDPYHATPDPSLRARRVKKVRDGYCKLCGSKLSDPRSIRIGYGHKCYEKVPVIIILDIPEG